MFRSTVLSIVLTLMAGPNASILCKAWCDLADAAAQECHHRDATTLTALTCTDDCDNPVFTRAVLLKEDVRRRVSSPDTHQAPIVPRYQYFASKRGTHICDEPGRGSPLAQQPLVTALRI